MLLLSVSTVPQPCIITISTHHLYLDFSFETLMSIRLPTLHPVVHGIYSSDFPFFRLLCSDSKHILFIIKFEGLFTEWHSICMILGHHATTFVFVNHNDKNASDISPSHCLVRFSSTSSFFLVAEPAFSLQVLTSIRCHN